jgi:hypothetical protein
MSIIKLLIALCSYASAYGATSQPELAAATTQGIAEPISPATLKRFPHLAPYVGHVLLGTPEVQAVLAGITAVPGKSDWQPAGLAFFTASGPPQEPVWHQQQAVTGIDLKSSGPKNAPPPHQLAVDLGVDQESGAPFARFIYGNSSSAASKLTVTWSLDNKSARLSLAFEAIGGNGAPLANWLLRLNGHAENILGPVTTPEKGTRNNGGSQYMLRYQDTEVVGILGYQRFAFDNNTLSWQPPSQGSNRPAPVYGIELALSSATAGSILSQAEALKICLNSNHRIFKNHHDPAMSRWRTTCESPPNSGLLRLKLNPKDAAVKIPQPIFIFDRDGHLLQVTVLTDEQHQTIELPPGTGYQLADTAGGRTFNELSPFSITAGQAHEVTLPPRELGSLQIVTTPDSPNAALLSIEPTIAGYPNAAPLVADGSFALLPLRLSHRTWLTSNDHISIKLLAGSYLVTLANGRIGSFCSKKVVISPGQLSSLSCSKIESNLDNQRTQDFIYGNLSPSPHILQDESKQNTSADNIPKLSTELSEALGLDFMSSSPNVKAENQKHLVPIIEIPSESSDLVLRYWPANKDLTERWTQALKTGDSEVFGHFKRFLKDEGATGWLEVGCPAPTMSITDLEQLILTLQPNALQLFGCSSHHRQDELMDLWERIAHSNEVPVLLTAAPIDFTSDQESFIPRLVIDKQSATQPLQLDAWSLLQRRNFGLSAGAVTFIRELRATAQAPSNHKLKNTNVDKYDLIIDLNLLSGANPKEILVFTESGRAKKMYPPTNFDRKGLITLHDLTLGKAQWLRVEIRGTPKEPVLNASDPDDSSQSYPILATTNFLKISDLVSKDTKAKEPP